MNKLMVRMLAGLIACTAATNTAFAQAADTPFQVDFATEVTAIPTLITLSNSGASSTVASPQNGAICANAYAFSTSGPLLACCSCRLGANNLRQVSVRNDLLLSANKAPPDSVVLKLMASTGSGGTCNASTVGTGANVLVTGMLAWTRRGTAGVNIVVPFTPATLSAAELVSINTQCAVLEPSGRACGSCP